MKILFIRHGQTYDNLENLLTWQKEVALTETGHLQAKELAKKLEAYHIDYIYCSSMQRARDTITPYIEKHKDIGISYADKLKEANLGALNGAPEDAEETKEERSKWLDHKVWGGESLRDLYLRAKNFLAEIKEKHNNETVLIVWHNAINRNIIGIIHNYDIEEINTKKERYGHTEILSLDVDIWKK